MEEQLYQVGLGGTLGSTLGFVLYNYKDNILKVLRGYSEPEIIGMASVASLIVIGSVYYLHKYYSDKST